MPNKLIPLNSEVANRRPAPANLEPGELATNLNDRRMYSKNASGALVEFYDREKTGTLGTVLRVGVNGETIYTVTLAATVTLTDGLEDGQSITVVVAGGDTHAITFPGGIKWAGKDASALGAEAVLVFWKIGAQLYGSNIGDVA